MSEDDRRQFPRLELSEDAFAVDEKDGSQLGRVAEAGGGGFLIYPATPEAIKKLSVGNRLRITVQLINTTDGYHLWSERYDREMKDIFDVQDEITLAVVDALKVKLLGELPQIEPPTQNTGAYELYLKGRSLLYQRGLSIAKAIECYRPALPSSGSCP